MFVVVTVIICGHIRTAVEGGHRGPVAARGQMEHGNCTRCGGYLGDIVGHRWKRSTLTLKPQMTRINISVMWLRQVNR